MEQELTVVTCFYVDREKKNNRQNDDLGEDT